MDIHSAMRIKTFIFNYVKVNATLFSLCFHTPRWDFLSHLHFYAFIISQLIKRNGRQQWKQHLYANYTQIYYFCNLSRSSRRMDDVILSRLRVNIKTGKCFSSQEKVNGKLGLHKLEFKLCISAYADGSKSKISISSRHVRTLIQSNCELRSLTGHDPLCACSSQC